MTPLFENKSDITLEKYLYQCNTPIGKKAIKDLKRWKGTQIGGIVIMLISTGLFFVADAASLSVVSIALIMAFAYNLLFKRNKQNTKLYNQIIQNQPDGKWIRTITFEKDIKVTDGNTVTTFKYHEFVKFDETERYYLIFKNENAVLRIEKGCFTTGEESEFVKFIKRKIKK